MHIAIDARIANSSTGTYHVELIRHLQKIDTDNTYTILLPAKDLDYITIVNPNFRVKAADYDNYSLEEQTSFKTFLDELNADLVHFCMPQQPIRYKGKHVTTVHDLTLLKTYNSDKNWLVYHIKQAVARYVFKKIAKTSKHIIVPTQFTKDEYVHYTHISPAKITVTYESADASIGSLKPYTHPFKQFLMYVGQQSDYKNIQRLGDAHQKLLVEHPDLGLVLVGKKNAASRKNEAYFASKNYQNILFTDFIEDAQRDWLYTQCAAYVFPSLMEGFGLPGLEAMGRGAPVVSSNATCLPEVYGNAAHYFSPTDVDVMAHAINDILVDAALRQDLIQKGFAQFKKYSWERMAKQTHAIYMRALNEEPNT